MNREQITAALRERQELLFLAAGAILLIGAARGWGWLCDPAGTRQAHSALGRGGRRLLFGCCGGLLFGIGLCLILR